MKEEKTRFLLAGLFLLAAVFVIPEAKQTYARERNIVLRDDWFTDDWYEDENDSDYFYIGDTGHIEVVYNNFWNQDIVRLEYISNAENVVLVDAQGNYRVVGSGSAEVMVNGYTADQERVFEESYEFRVCADLSGAGLGKTYVKQYLWETCGGTDTSVPLKNAPKIEYYTFDYTSSNKRMKVYCYFDSDEKAVQIQSESAGSTTLTFTINGKVFQLELKVTEVKMAKKSVVLAQKKKVVLKLKGFHGKVKWGSTRKKVARVSSKGVVKARKTGNTAIYATHDGKRVGCIVSVVTPAKKRVVSEAKKIAKGVYSQEKRMQKGYYDCSSLVWRSYKKAGKYFGDKNYAPVAANIAKWCFGKKKRIKGGLSDDNVNKMKLRPGDLFFEGGEHNGRYKGIYHVEMFIGYRWRGFYGNKPIVDCLWAARPANYYFGGMMARP